jgi:hypothetical protein
VTALLHGDACEPFDTLPRTFRVRIRRLVDPPRHWLWVGAINSNGYGRYAQPLAPGSRGGGRRRFWTAHRFAYDRLVGPIPVGLVLDHLCGERLCCYPAHLEPVTVQENSRRVHHRDLEPGVLWVPPVESPWTTGEQLELEL